MTSDAAVAADDTAANASSGSGDSTRAVQAASSARLQRVLRECDDLVEDVYSREQSLVEALRIAGLKRGQVCGLCMFALPW